LLLRVEAAQKLRRGRMLDFRKRMGHNVPLPGPTAGRLDQPFWPKSTTGSRLRLTTNGGQMYS
jgi:hypothetical protein